MDLQKMLDQQRKRRPNKLKEVSNAPLVKDYLTDPDAARPYNNNINADKTSIKATQNNKIKDTKATQNKEKPVENPVKETQQQQLETTQITTQINKQAGRKPFTKWLYSMLTGNALKIIDGIYIECVEKQSLETNFIEKNVFSQRVGVKIGSIRNTCVRLKNYNILVDFVATKGPGSSWKFILASHIYDEICSSKNHNGDTNNDTSLLSSSSVNISNTTKLPTSWLNINYKELQLALLEVTNSERFGIPQLKSIYNVIEDKLSAADIQRSIDNFAWGLKNNLMAAPYQRKVKIASLIETLKNGEVFIEPKLSSNSAGLNTDNSSNEKNSKQMELFEAQFLEYYNSLAPEYIENMVPDSFKITNPLWKFAVEKKQESTIKGLSKDWAREYFEKEIWPSMKKARDCK